MTALTKRQAAEKVIENMPIGVDLPLRKLAAQAKAGRYRLSNGEMARFLLEAARKGKVEKRPFYITVLGASLPRTAYRRTEK